MRPKIFKFRWIFILISAPCYFVLAYHTPRTDFQQFIALCTCLFACYFLLLKFYKAEGSWKEILLLGLLLRLVFLLADPALSDDYYRFYWDGKLLAADQNPFKELPSELQASNKHVEFGLSDEIFEKLNSPNYHTVYPPIHQAIFYAGVKLGMGSLEGFVLALRLLLIAFEAGIIILLVHLLRHFQARETTVALYAFNPLVIMELTGNLHFEGAMMCFFLLALFLLFNKMEKLSAFLFAAAAAVKLLPLLFAPFLVKRLGWANFVTYGLVVVVALVAMFIPFVSGEQLTHFGSSLDLYFQHFEFNASMYYVVRWIGEWLVGYNTIHLAGPLLAVIAGGVVLFLAIGERAATWKNLATVLLFALAVHFLFSPVIHPWYLTSLVVLSVLTKYRFAVVWSGVAVLTYSAYGAEVFEENMALVVLEYAVVLAVLVLELRKKLLDKLHAAIENFL